MTVNDCTVHIREMIEIERKFLVVKDKWPHSDERILMRQGYLAQQGKLVCRVRQKNEQFYLSVKAAIDNLSSYDYEYPIPREDGETMLSKLCDHASVSKTRHLIRQDDLVWEIDEFHDANDGLVVAEIELPSAEHPFVNPDWLGEEISDDKRYTNYALYCKPHSEW